MAMLLAAKEEEEGGVMQRLANAAPPTAPLRPLAPAVGLDLALRVQSMVVVLAAWSGVVVVVRGGRKHEEEKEEQVASHARPGRLAPPVDTQRRHTKAKEVCPVGGNVSYACARWSRWSG